MTMHLTDQSGTSPFQRRLLRRAELSASKRGQDAVSGIKSGLSGGTKPQLTQLGRPDWDQIFGAIKQAHPHDTVGVFYCGNPTLERVLRKKCEAWSDNQTWFRMHSEKF